MFNSRIQLAVAAIALFVVATSSAVAADCYNLAYRYCCQHHPWFTVSCPEVEGGVCTGLVIGGVNDFGQVLIPPGSGAMTANSFQSTGNLLCHAWLPVCNDEPDPDECDYSSVPWELGCTSYERKTQWQFCEIIP